MKRVLIVAGDPSGDIIAARLVESMRKLDPDLQVTGVGGDQLERVSDRFLKNIVRQHALGFAISPKKVLFFRDILNHLIIPEIRDNRPDAVIPVDFYGFNYRVARAAKTLGCPVFYYVSPQFWASRPGRADKLRRFVDLFLCLFPFETQFYEKRGLAARFVGHPILDQIPTPDRDGGPGRVELNVGLLPGSRPDEINRHLPVMLDVADRLHRVHPRFRLVLFTVPHVHRDIYTEIIAKFRKSPVLIDLVQDEAYAWRSQLDLALTASGMETLENTLLGIPMAVMYKTNWITYLIARSLIKIDYLAMPNLLAGESIVPEFIQMNATADRIVKPLIRWIESPGERRAVRSRLLALRRQFGETGASERAARTILEGVS